MTAALGPRHLTREGLAQYIDAGIPAVVKIAGQPEAILVVDPDDDTIAVRIDRHAGEAPDLELFKHFVATTLAWQGKQWVEIRIAPGIDRFEAYPVLCAVVDRVQLEGAQTGPAALLTLENYRELLASQERLSDEAETGLFGELLVLKHYIGRYGEDVALDAWCGPDAAEHDFCLPTYDVEAKTTTAEARQHWINDLRQLVPSPHRPLYLLSIQLTSGGATGLRLPELVGHVRSILSPEASERFGLVLQSGYHWKAIQDPLYRRVLRLRSTTAAYLVDDAFPAITPKTLAHAALDESRFVKVRYQLDLSGLATAAFAPDHLATIGAPLP